MCESLNFGMFLKLLFHGQCCQLARLKGFAKLTSADEALAILLKTLKLRKPETSEIAIDEAFCRVTVADVIAPIDLPPFDRSAVDGYVVKAEDTLEASQFNPKTLQITSESVVKEGKAKQVWTGNPLPNGADAVVMLEHTKAVKKGIRVLAALTPGGNVSKRGEDVRKGSVVIASGTRLQPHHVSLLAALCISRVPVAEKPKVAVLATGNELVDLGEKPQPYQIINSNRFLISGLVTELGAEPLNLGIARDNVDQIAVKITEGLQKTDSVITTGGTSVGAVDLVTVAIDKMGKPGVLVHGIGMRPGTPTALAVLSGKPIFVLSGYPVAAAMGFEVFARPVLLKLIGIENEPRPVLKAKLTRRVAGALGRRVYLRVKVVMKDTDFLAEPVSTKGSGLLTSMTKANGYVIIPEDREGLEEGEIVLVQLFAPTGGA